MYFVDDSGDHMTGTAVYSWIEVDATQAAHAMAVWLRFRQQLFDQYKIPADKEIHSVYFLSGRGHPSREAKWNQSKQLRREIYVEALRTIAGLPGVRVGAVYRTTERRRGGFAWVARDVFCKLVLGVDRRLFLASLQGLMAIDGDGSDRTYARAFRTLNLSERHLTGGLFFQPADDSQWIQIADIVAYTAYQAVLRRPGAEFCWTWYEDFLDPDGPLAV